MLRQYVENKKPEKKQSTVGVEFLTKDVILANGQSIRAQLWDTAGQERYRSLANIHFKKAQGCLLVYDITNRDSYDRLGDIIESIKERANKNIQVLLVGNKLDLA